ncbi:hypothetical protein KGF57_001634 [Candida theae]|uniref:Chromosome transmission fidelity protein 8 n=1 Tax=Candida theae TaxID=1198502 RepID=A0AAD5BH86_9ASCO|nr:uncharacterized protein KGF57_001634 [Candida theae]KAI5961700.1 hypothetical protein KGF57_001634 [Candida theae]
MPTAKINCSAVQQLLSQEKCKPNSSSSSVPNLITTPYGLALLEIQGELNLPHTKPDISLDQLSPLDQEKMKNFVTVDDVYDAVKFGHLQFDSKDESRVTLFIGKSQRLIGNVVKLDIPLGVLKVPLRQEIRNEDDDDVDMDAEQEIQMIDIVRAKMIFKQRPLPIM